MSSSKNLPLKAKTSFNKLVISDKHSVQTWKQCANDLKKQNEQLQIQNDQLQRNVKDLESKCEALLKTVLDQSIADDCPASISFAGLIKQPLGEVMVKLCNLQKKQSDVGTLSNRVEELETRLTSNYNEIAKLLQIKMNVESCLEQVLICGDLPEAKNIARKTLDECSQVYLFISSPERKMLNTASLKIEKSKTENNSSQDSQHLPHLTKPSQKFPGDTHISKIEPNLKVHIFYELNKETRKGNDWRLLAERVGIEKTTIDTWQANKLENPMANVWLVWAQSPGATMRMIHRHLISPQMKNSLLARNVSDFYHVI